MDLILGRGGDRVVTFCSVQLMHNSHHWLRTNTVKCITGVALAYKNGPPVDG